MHCSEERVARRLHASNMQLKHLLTEQYQLVYLQSPYQQRQTADHLAQLLLVGAAHKFCIFPFDL